MNQINFNDILNLFNEENEWHIGYLLKEDINFLNDAPIKTSGLDRYFEEKNALCFIKHTIDYDYSMYKIITERLSSIKDLKYELWTETNFKNAAVLAGLGQYGKNQMFYDDIFGFDIHIVLIILKNELINLPERKKPNWNFLPQCEGCNDCYNACPVKAIHNKEKPYWVDMASCDNFATWGDHETIPSMKRIWGKKILDPPLSDKILNELKSPEDALELLGFQLKLPIIIKGKEYYVQLPTCRECASQPKCSKYGGKYPYDPNRYKLYEL